MSHVRKMALCLVFVATGSACASASVPLATAADSEWAARTWPDATSAQLQQGRRAYVLRCTGCHALVPPAEHTPARWREEVGLMADRSLLLQADRDAILRYLLTISRDVTVDQRPAAARL